MFYWGNLIIISTRKKGRFIFDVFYKAENKFVIMGYKIIIFNFFLDKHV